MFYALGNDTQVLLGLIAGHEVRGGATNQPIRLEGDPEQAGKIHYELLPLFKAMFIETNPIPVKTTLAEMGMIAEEFRLPLCRMSEENRSKLLSVISHYKLIKQKEPH